MDGTCDDCGGVDYEWMNTCSTHPFIELCRGCECPCCAEDDEHDEEEF